MKQGKIVICNIIMAVISVVAAVTLIAGSFLTITATLNIDGETMSQMIGEQNLTESEGDASGEGDAAGTPDISEMLKEVNLTIPVNLDFKSKDLIESAIGDAAVQVQKLLQREIGGVVDVLMDAVDQALPAVVGQAVNQVVKKAEDEVRAQLEEASGGEVSEEEIRDRLENEYGVTDKDITTLKDELATVVTAVLNGGADESKEILEKSETLNKLIYVYAETELKQQTGETTVTQAEIDAKAQELKTEVIDEYEEGLKQLEIDGEINKETAVVSLLNKGEMKDENGAVIKFENLDDVKAYFVTQVEAALGESTRYLEIGMKALGIFTLIVAAAWVYFLLKIIVKTLFSKYNKTVGMFFPRFFGWMPHVFFVGVPMLILGNLDKIAQLAEQNEMVAGLSDMLQTYAGMVTIDIASLTWVSAVGSVLLLIILFPYYQWRRKAKKEAKRLKRENDI